MNTEPSKLTPELGGRLHGEPLAGTHADLAAEADAQAASVTRALMSSLCDGDASAAGPACTAWAQDQQARQAWHEYHLIGDVLRSDDLALRPQGDAAFLAALRTRLAQEPVPLAPQPQPQPLVPTARAPISVSAMGWRAPAAVAAGFAAVAVVLGSVQWGSGSSGTAGDLLAGAGLSSRGFSAGTQLVSAPAGVGFVAAPESLMIRNPELDAHLRAHQAARLRSAAEPSASSLRGTPILIPPDLAVAQVFKPTPQNRIGFGLREVAP